MSDLHAFHQPSHYNEKIVCPALLRKGLYTVSALDNRPQSLLHNISGLFHGTGVSIFQFPTCQNQGTYKKQPKIEASCSTMDFSLPDNYTTVPAVTCRVNKLSVPEASLKEVSGRLEDAIKIKDEWTKCGIYLLNKNKLEYDDRLSWATYHACHQPDPTDPAALNTLLPLFNDKAATFAIVKHRMGIVQRITAHLNPGQMSVISLDQPLFALAKFVQWQFPSTHGEQNILVMFGGLHIEMALWNTIGDFLEGSGWTNILSEAGIASLGTADSFLRAKHLTKTRHSHQVTALALSKLQVDAWEIYRVSDPKAVFQDWKCYMLAKSPTFHFWNIILEFETLCLIFIKAHRTKDLDLYIETLDALVIWFFALDKYNYARWVPIHLRDLKSLTSSAKEHLEKMLGYLQNQEEIFSNAN